MRGASVKTALTPSSRRESAEVADVVERFDGFDIEAGIARHTEALTRFIEFPVSFTFDARTTGSCRDFHDLRNAGIEYQRRGQDHADGFFRPISEHDGV